MSNSLDPHQALHYVGPDWGPICLQRSSADDTSSLVGKEFISCYISSLYLVTLLFSAIKLSLDKYIVAIYLSLDKIFFTISTPLKVYNQKV